MLNIDSDFPGGNIIVEKIDGDEVWLRQDLRDTEGCWFYWCCRVSGAAGRDVALHFTNGDVLTPLGPSVSTDFVRWSWAGAEVVKESADSGNVRVTVRVPDDADALYLTYSIPYVGANLRAFLRKHRGRPELRVSALATSEQGRTVETLVVRDPNARRPAKVLLTARHHACESVANYAMEGLVDFALDRASGFLERAEIVAIPLVDKDGVENGDQGKNRRPHDHNRDYVAEPIYAATAALMRELAEWGGELAAAFDMHCPGIRGGRNETLFFTRPPESHMAEFRRFSDRLAESPAAELRYDPADDLPFGEEWHKPGLPTCANYVRENSAARLVAGLEVPYALAGGETVTADRARAVGRDLARAVLRYLESAGA